MTQNTSFVIETRGLTKTYRRFEKEAGFLGSVKSLFHRKYLEKTAVSHLDLQVAQGEFVGMIGPNGAGKTTLVKMLTGIIAPTSGDISVLGFYPNNLSDELRCQYAVVMGQKSQLFFELTAADTFLLFRELYGIPEARYRRNLDYFINLFDAADFLNVQVRTLSLGERMKMELIVALLHDPKVLFLDEPTIGLDAVAQKQIRRFLREVNEEKGTTILLTSHYMEDIQSLCKRCVVINGGEKLYDGGAEELFRRYQTHKRISVTFEGECPERLAANWPILKREPGRLQFQAPRAQAQAALRLLMEHPGLLDVTVEEDEIGSVVERIYQESPGRRSEPNNDGK